MSRFDCPMCEKKAKKLVKYYEGIECFQGYCSKCQFKWLPHEEEMKIDSKMNEVIAKEKAQVQRGEE